MVTSYKLRWYCFNHVLNINATFYLPYFCHICASIKCAPQPQPMPATLCMYGPLHCYYSLNSDPHVGAPKSKTITGFPLIREIREKFYNFPVREIREKQEFSGTIREKVCQSGNIFQPAKIVFANHVFFSLGRVRLSGFHSMSGANLSCI